MQGTTSDGPIGGKKSAELRLLSLCELEEENPWELLLDEDVTPRLLLDELNP